MSFNKQIIDYNFSSKVSEYNTNANIQKKTAKKLCKIFVENIDKKISQEQIINLHRLKTGELFMASTECGAILGGANQEERLALRFYAHDLGLAFQIKDDILDYIDIEIGKAEIKKITHKKPKENASIVDIIGFEQAEQKLKILSEQAKDHLKIFGKKADILRDLVDLLVNRSN
jgi:farnesyl diphosphate synthase